MAADGSNIACSFMIEWDGSRSSSCGARSEAQPRSELIESSGATFDSGLRQLRFYGTLPHNFFDHAIGLVGDV